MQKLREDGIKFLDELLEKEAAVGNIPGSSILIGDSEGSFFKNRYGQIREDSIFCLCSMTKPLTMTAAMLLLERGILESGDPVSKYLPAFSNPKVRKGSEIVDASREIRLFDLMNMTSGLIYPMDQGYGDDISPLVVSDLKGAMRKVKERIDNGEYVSCAQACDSLGTVPLAFDPGTRWAYGMSADVLAGVVEAASGEPYRDFLKYELLNPLGMEDTDYAVSKENASRVADIMSQEPGNPVMMSGLRGFPEDGRAIWEDPYVTSGGGGWMPVCGRGLYSTLSDYAKFCGMLLNEGKSEGRRILSEYSVREMRTAKLNAAQASYLWPGLLDGYGYGNLMRVMTSPDKSTSFGNAGEFGWDGLLGTYFFVDQAAGIYLVYMQQGPVDFSVRHKIRRIVYSALT